MIAASIAATVRLSVRRFRKTNPVVRKLIQIASLLIVLLGIIHISFAFPLYSNTDTLWFVGAGMAIVFSGLLNLVAIDRGGSKLTLSIAAIVNAVNFISFCFALPILNQPQVYVGIAIFLTTTIALLLVRFRI